MPNSILWIGLVVLWVFVLFPILAGRHPRIRQTTDVALATRVLHRGGSKRRMRKGPAAGHDSDPDYRPSRAHRKLAHTDDDVEDRMSTPADEHVTAAESERPRQLALEAGSAGTEDAPDSADAELADPTDTDPPVATEADRTARSAAEHDDPADDDDVADEYTDATAARIPPARSAAPARIAAAEADLDARAEDESGSDDQGYSSDGQQSRVGEGEYGLDSSEHGSDRDGRGADGEGYGSDGDGYGPDGQGYGPDGEGYGSDSEGYGPDGDGYGPDAQGYGPDAQGYGPDGESYGPDGEGYGPDGESGDTDYADTDHSAAGRRGDPDFVPTRRGRGGYDPEADAIARAARYTFRQRAVLGLVLAAITCGALGVAVNPLAWWGCGLSIVVLVTYLAYLRKQVRMEEDIRRRRSARLGRGHGHAGATAHYRAEEHARRVMDRDTARSLRRRSTLLETDDEDPAFHHLDPFDPAAARALRRATAGDMRRAAGE
ncbi:divisome protein SepX/GlpR [Nocardia takedensis]|uniref:divisome protein SepX/GlpR n=1 Tax=Nocardia takedensis TaxID=259390 RepID=UPI0002D5D365